MVYLRNQCFCSMARGEMHKVLRLDSVDSTNSEAKRKIAALGNMSVIAAYEQTLGRGQRGNIWLSEPGQNLTFSIVLKYGQMQVKMKAQEQFKISEITALSVVDLLAEYGIEARIKLPNDIYVGDRKICGILIEHALQGESLEHSIVGVGLNVNQVMFDPSLPNPVSMRQCVSQAQDPFDLDTLLKQFMDIFCSHLQKIIIFAPGN